METNQNKIKKSKNAWERTPEELSIHIQPEPGEPKPLNSLAGEKIHEAFHKFLYESPVATNFEDALQDIQENLFAAEIFQYNNFVLISDNVENIYSKNKDGGKFILKNAHDNSLATNNGTCAALSEKAYRLIRAKYPWINMLMVAGFEKGFGEYNHCFLLVFDDNIEFATSPNKSTPPKKTSTNEDINEFNNDSIIHINGEGYRIVDPSYRTITKIDSITSEAESYQVKVIYSRDTASKKKDVVLEGTEVTFIPLLNMSEKELFEIGFNFKTGEIFAAVTFGDKRKIFKNLQDPAFREIVRNSPELRGFYEKLAKKEVKIEVDE